MTNCGYGADKNWDVPKLLMRMDMVMSDGLMVTVTGMVMGMNIVVCRRGRSARTRSDRIRPTLSAWTAHREIYITHVTPPHRRHREPPSGWELF